MALIRKLNSWLERMLWHKNDTSETLELKVYLVRNGIIAMSLIIITFALIYVIYHPVYLLLAVSPLLFAIMITDSLLMVIKKGVKWFMYFYYSGYILVCCLVVLSFGGLPNSMGGWGGAFIVFMHTLAVKNRNIVILNAFLYSVCLVIIVLAFPFLSPVRDWTPKINNFSFTLTEIWMCLFVVKSFYDSIVVRTNEAKRRAEHLEELDFLKSKLYANITHEFRTPLTLIRGNAEEIKERHDGEISEKANNIVQSSDKILFLVNQMLNLSKIEEGKVPVHFIQCDLVAFVRFIAGSFQGYAEMRKISLHYEPQSAQLIMDIEAEKLEESISNLISNAIKYTNEGGNVFINLRKLHSGKTSEQQVEISVSDTGIGIPEDQLDKIFIRFYRVEDKRFPYREGTGIGLTLVNEYIKLMKGTIRVNSIPGKGSEFVITLPVTNNAKIEEFISYNIKFQQKEDLNIGTIVGKSHCHRLLIIEDNRELREYLNRLLENKYHVLAAENGIRGIELAFAYIPDIILSDVMMPGKDGYQVCKELKNDFRTNHIPVVLLTARADTDSRITGIEHGADAYLTKPFNKKELMLCLHNLLVQRENMRLKFSSIYSDKKVDENNTGLNEKFLEMVISHLEKNYRNDRYGIHNLYSDMEISRGQLHRKLTALTGHSASNFIRNFRLQKAKKLLMETNENVSDIAFEVGFGDANYFSKAFIHEFGITATELRKSFR